MHYRSSLEVSVVIAVKILPVVQRLQLFLGESAKVVCQMRLKAARDICARAVYTCEKVIATTGAIVILPSCDIVDFTVDRNVYRQRRIRSIILLELFLGKNDLPGRDVCPEICVL